MRHCCRLLMLFVSVLASRLQPQRWKENALPRLPGTGMTVQLWSAAATSYLHDKAGDLYGATLNGGSYSCDGPGPCAAVMCRLSPPAPSGQAWNETILYVLEGRTCNDGCSRWRRVDEPETAGYELEQRAAARRSGRLWNGMVARGDLDRNGALQFSGRQRRLFRNRRSGVRQGR